MKTFIVTPKAGGPAVYQYGAEAPLDMADFPFSDFDHTEQVEAPEPPAQKYGGRRIISHEELRELFYPEEQWAIDAFEVGFEATYPVEPEYQKVIKNRIRSGLKSYYAAQVVDLDNPKVEMLLGIFAGLQLIYPPSRITEILNG